MQDLCKSPAELPDSTHLLPFPSALLLTGLGLVSLAFPSGSSGITYKLLAPFPSVHHKMEPV